VRYFYNPTCTKITGLKQHPYINELQRDFKQDVKQLGLDPFKKEDKPPTAP
jgi:hypothetical protein